MKKLVDVSDEVYKAISQKVNQLDKSEYTYTDVINKLKDVFCPFAYYATGFLMKRYGRRLEVGAAKIIIMPTTPIHFNLIKIFCETGTVECIYESVNAPKYSNSERIDIGGQEYEEREYEADKIRKPRQWSAKYPRLETLLAFSDAELVSELRNRAYNVTCEKTIQTIL